MLQSIDSFIKNIPLEAFILNLLLWRQIPLQNILITGNSILSGYLAGKHMDIPITCKARNNIYIDKKSKYGFFDRNIHYLSWTILFHLYPFFLLFIQFSKRKNVSFILKNNS